MKFTSKKRLAARMLEVGVERVWFDPLRLDDIQQAITRRDIEDLVKDRAIRVKNEKPQAKNVYRKRKKSGSKRISVKARKRKYIGKIRKIRRHLAEIHEKGEISLEEKKKMRAWAKAGTFRSTRHLKETLKTIK